MMKNLQEISKLLECSPVSPIGFQNVMIDSRKVQAGDLFVALRGERFDGHDFMVEVAQKGAVAIICEKSCPQLVDIPQFVVSSSLDALAKVAAYYRQRITCPIIAVTGSNGKTSVKEMIACILPKPAYATPGNLNNHIGVPLSLMQLNETHRYAAFELGANHSGEIAYSVAMVKPTVTLINNIAPAHIAGFGSLDGVARAKGEIHQGLVSGGTAVINDDDHYAHFWDELLSGKKVLRFSSKKPADIAASEIQYDADGCASFTLSLPDAEAKIQLRVPGDHMVQNALAAASCCYAVGIEMNSIVDGLTHFGGVSGRMTYLEGKNHALIIDDTYNANLQSVLTAVDVLAKRQGQRILVLGDLGELGVFTQEHHEKIGRVAKEKGINRLLTCGKQSQFSAEAFGQAARHYSNQKELTQDLLPFLNKDTTVLVKGSRSAAMENVVHELVG
jgi:UDP-N-acetylmuramoyl-tripeptide--D-alanyl-D-alanine ligase